jgi:hypothetical protein
MSDKSPRQTMSKTSGKSLKEKRAAKHAKAALRRRVHRGVTSRQVTSRQEALRVNDFHLGTRRYLDGVNRR